MPEYVGYDDANGGDDDYTGADDAEILGAVRRVMTARKPQLQAAAQPPKKLRGYLGLGTATFTSVSGTLLTLTVEPQRAFRPERLIIDRGDGSTVTAGIQSRVSAIYVGDQPQSPSVEQPAPTAMFRADATVSGVDFDKAVPGQKIQVNLSVSSAPTGTEFISLSCGFYGDMLR